MVSIEINCLREPDWIIWKIRGFWARWLHRYLVYPYCRCECHPVREVWLEYLPNAIHFFLWEKFRFIFFKNRHPKIDDWTHSIQPMHFLPEWVNRILFFPLQIRELKMLRINQHKKRSGEIV